MSDDIQVGDKVRITIEDVVIKVERSGRTVYLKNEAEDDLWFDLDEGNVASVEVVEKAKPPVVTFKPGDRLRRKGWAPIGYEITLADDGYLLHHVSGKVQYSKYGPNGAEWFNSENFDKVELHEAPL